MLTKFNISLSFQIWNCRIPDCTRVLVCQKVEKVLGLVLYQLNVVLEHCFTGQQTRVSFQGRLDVLDY